MAEGIPLYDTYFRGSCCPCLCLFETVRRTGAQVADRPFSEREEEIVPYGYGYKKSPAALSCAAGDFF